MEDLTEELKDVVPYAVGVRNIMNKAEILEKLTEFLASKEG